MYVALLKYDTWQKSVYLEGDDSEQGEANFKKTLQELEGVGQASADWPDYLKNAIHHLSVNGFGQIPK